MISEQHKQEWLDSGVNPEIIKLNVLSLTGDLSLEYVLFGLTREDRRNDGRLRDHWLKRYEHLLDGGWWCSGYDVITKEDAKWGCFKPDSPRTDSKAKPIKYEHPPKVATEIFTLNVPDSIWAKIADRYDLETSTSPNFWEWVINNTSVPVILTEGAKKAGALLTAGYAAIALPGVNNAIQSEDNLLIKHLQIFSHKNREIIFAFDQDKKWKTVQAVNRAISSTGKLFEKQGCNISVARWRYTDGKGVDDVITSQGALAWHLILERRISLEQFEKIRKAKPQKMDIDDVLEFVKVEFEGRLAFDELNSQIMLDDRPLVLTDELRCWLLDQYKIQCSKVSLNDAITYQAKKRSFHPVREYLEKVEKTVKPISIDNLSSRYLQTSDQIYDIFLKRWLVGAVARVFDPGCKLDTALIFQGDQGIKKSTFFEVLGGEWFNDSLEDISTKDALLALHKYWIHEMGEFERITSKKSAAEVKVFLSKKSDAFRKPYGKEVQDFSRACVLCGSVNKTSFLVDETGSRRFWVIPVGDALSKIDVVQLAQERDAIWAEAIRLYRSGEQWWLTDKEQELSTANNDRFEVCDEWQSDVEKFLEGKDKVSVSEVLLYQFEIEVANHDRATQMRIANILTRLNWQKLGRKAHLGKIQVVWIPKPKKIKTVADGMQGMQGMQQDQKSTAHLHTSAYLPAQFSFKLEERRGTWGDKPRYVHPPNAFSPGERVVFETSVYKVVASTHTHVLLEGFEKSIPIWQVERLEK